MLSLCSLSSFSDEICCQVVRINLIFGVNMKIV